MNVDFDDMLSDLEDDGDEFLSTDDFATQLKEEVYCVFSSEHSFIQDKKISGSYKLTNVPHEKYDIDQCCKTLEQNDIHLLLFECRLIEGIKDLQIIREIRERNSLISIIAISANEDEEYLSDLYKFGVTDCMIGEINPKILSNKMKVYKGFSDKINYVKIQNEEMISSIEQIKAAHEKNRKMQEEYARKLEKEVELKTASLNATRKDLSEMLNNLTFAILTVDRELKILPNYSAYTNNVLHTDQNLTNQSFIELLFTNSDIEKSVVEEMEVSLKNSFDMDEVQWMMSGSYCINRVAKKCLDLDDPEKETFFKLNYYPIYKDDLVFKIMISIEDITEKLRLQESSKRHEQEIKMLTELIHNDSAAMRMFFEEMEAFIKESFLVIDQMSDLKDLMSLTQKLYRVIHTIKGNSRTFNLLVITDVIHEIESRITEIQKNIEFATVDTVKSLEEGVKEIETCFYKYKSKFDKLISTFIGEESKSKSVDKNGLSYWEPLVDFLQFHHPHIYYPRSRQLYQEFYSHLHHLANFPSYHEFGNRKNKYSQIVTDLAEESGKKAVFVAEIPEPLSLPKKVLSVVDQCLIHMVRNAIDHGIESPEIRLQQKKEDTGVITLTAIEYLHTWKFVLKDNGSGMDTKEVLKSALKKGVISSEKVESMKVDEIPLLIMESGMSTAKKVTTVSGRGVGMDFVKSSIEELGGTIELYNLPKEGTSFSITVPKDFENHMNKNII